MKSAGRVVNREEHGVVRDVAVSIGWRWARLLAFAVLPVLFLPLRAAEPPPAPATTPGNAAPDAGSDARTTPNERSTTPATSATPPTPAASERATSADDEEGSEDPQERVSADNNLSFPVDI